MNSAIYKTRGGESITTRNHPLPYTKKETVFLSGVSSFFIAIGVVIGFAFISAFYASFLVLERESNVKHQQVPLALVLLVQVVATYFRECVVDVGILPTRVGDSAVDFRRRHHIVLGLDALVGLLAVPDPGV
jgi:hypothetical protein